MEHEPRVEAENGRRGSSGAGSPAPEKILEAESDAESPRNFNEGWTPIFEEQEDLHFRFIMPVHVIDVDNRSEAQSQSSPESTQNLGRQVETTNPIQNLENQALVKWQEGG